MLKLFISHASEDEELARKIVVLISTALLLRADSIRCTSVDGYRLPAGADTNDQLRQEVLDSAAFIGILSHASMHSTWVLFELGARWGAGKNLIPLIAHGALMSLIDGPISGLNVIRADSRDQLHQLVGDLSGQLNIQPQSPAAYGRVLEDVLSHQPAKPVNTPAADSPPITVVRNSSKFEVARNQSVIDDLSGASVGLLHINSSTNSAHLKIALPGKEAIVFSEMTAGHVWSFEADGTAYRMYLTSVNFANYSATFEVRKLSK